MQRREAVKRVTAMLGGVLSAPLLAGVLNGCKADESPDWTPSYLNAEQDKLVKVLADLIIPATEDSPAANAALVNRFIDQILPSCYTKADQDAFLKGLAALEETAKSKTKGAFVKASEADQIAMLQELDEAAMQHRKAGNPGQPFFTMLKELVLTGYFTAEVGATQALAYVHVPGGYQGCFTMEPGQKTWAI
jgi:hypothetical protein